jgi:short-subunit dehydrogenase
MTECWRAELRQFNVRVMLVNPSEVLTSFGAAAGFDQKVQPDQAASGGNRPRRQGDSGNGRPRIYSGANRFRH